MKTGTTGLIKMNTSVQTSPTTAYLAKALMTGIINLFIQEQMSAWQDSSGSVAKCLD